MPVSHELAVQLGRVEELEKPAKLVAELAGKATAPDPVKSVLSGSWLGHRLHPLLTDVTIGALMSASILDWIGGRNARKGADRLIGLGLLSVLPTAAAGASDWSETYAESRRIGLVHGAVNVLGAGLYLACLN